jgi:molybdopterin-guanine dinucleotide biosynthesis adapter protein
MKVLGIVGWSGSGKTTLIVELVRELTARGLRVSTMKHAHHGFDIDQPGKDSFRHRDAGAEEVMIASDSRWALVSELRTAPEPSVDDLIAKMSPVDLLLIEGFKDHPHAKIEVFRAERAMPALWPTDPQIIAVASDRPIVNPGRPVLPLNDPGVMVDFIMTHCGLRQRPMVAA